MKSSRVSWTALSLVVVGALAACSQPNPPSGAQGYTPVPQPSPERGTVVKVERGSMSETVEARGRVVAASEALLSFALEGVLTDVHVNPGDQVSEGDMLAEIDIRDWEGRSAEEQLADALYAIARAELNLRIAEEEAAIADAGAALCQHDIEKVAARLSKAQFEYQLASYLEQPDKPPEKESDFTRSQRWVLEFASLDYDKAVAACAAREAEVRYNAAIISLRRQALAHVRELFTRTQERAAQAQLDAPFSGIVISWDKRVGERIEPYELIGAIADPSILRVEAWVSEDEIQQVSVGQAASVILDVRAAETYAGEVVDMATEATVWQGKNVYLVDIEFADSDEVPASIRMGADVLIQTRSRVDVLLVPTAAIYGEDGHTFVEVVRDGGRSRTEVWTGASDGTHTEILTGLEAGQEVVVP